MNHHNEPITYYIQPPTYYKDAPAITRKFFYRALVRWADKEYRTAFDKSVEKGEFGLSRILSREWSGMRVLTTHPDFHWFCGQLFKDEKVWNEIGKPFRDFFCRALNIYEGLRTN